MPGGALVNIGDPELEYACYQAERRVLEIQAKLHRWAGEAPSRDFGGSIGPTRTAPSGPT